MSSITYPLSIRRTPPGADFTPLAVPGGEALHTGGLWVSPEGEVWKPLDGRPWLNADAHVATREAEVLEVMAGKPAFPRNWRVETRNGRKWLVRGKALVIGQDIPAEEVLLEWVLEVEQGVRALNRAGWLLGDRLTAAVDQDDRVFILDLSAAYRLGENEPWNDEDAFFQWAEGLGFKALTSLRRAARRLVEPIRCFKDPNWPRTEEGLPDLAYQYVYASRSRPMSPLWANIPGAHYVDADHASTGVWTWVVTQQALAQETTRRYDLTWAWSPVRERRRR